VFVYCLDLPVKNPAAEYLIIFKQYITYREFIDVFLAHTGWPFSDNKSVIHPDGNK
jgi:hypothetical protein